MSRSKRIMITGASGLLGRHFFQTFRQDTQWETLGLAFSRTGDGLKQLDLTNRELVSAAVKEFKPSVILHSAAERRPDVVEKDEDRTANLNVNATQHLCDLANDIDAYVVFISTDYVFDGTQPPYKPHDSTNPLNKYGRSKADGETTVLNASTENIVLRVPILYGHVEFLGESAVTVLFNKVKDASSLAEMNHFEKRYPTHCADVAEATKIMIDCRCTDPSVRGIYHCSGNEMMTKYDMAVNMAAAFKLPTDHLVADTKPAVGAPRPFNCHLDCSKLEALGVLCKTPFKEGIKSVLSNYYP